MIQGSEERRAERGRGLAFCSSARGSCAILNRTIGEEVEGDRVERRDPGRNYYRVVGY